MTFTIEFRRRGSGSTWWDVAEDKISRRDIAEAEAERLDKLSPKLEHRVVNADSEPSAQAYREAGAVYGEALIRLAERRAAEAAERAA
jgi:ketosteroid isomerase-like protein